MKRNADIGLFTNPSTKITKHPGTYALLFKCDIPFNAVAGKLGTVSITSGYWIYVGSALGAGGLKSRLAHHLKPSARQHWHIDYIKHGLRPVEIWTIADLVKREHDWANALSAMKDASQPITGFGASDCSCHSHLIHFPRRPKFSNFIKEALFVTITGWST